MTKYLGPLNPFRADLSWSLPNACERSGNSYNTCRSWCEKHNLGRKIGGSWHVVAVAFQLFLNGQDEALSRYLTGDRSDHEVVEAFERLGVPIEPPKPTRNPALRRRSACHAAA